MWIIICTRRFQLYPFYRQFPPYMAGQSSFVSLIFFFEPPTFDYILAALNQENMGQKQK